ncbi:MAG: aminomethyl-transferring glycine dehydrogenase [Elusimicrobia bacterium]|nr:aminomethyl-transferring glycine dehydrogenase [Elusimicrobiota bacterium]MDE2236642.1 aminomethyl-transferring glycine dehydrogenase [Elusimicrobiota bacterium]MDE2424618.1 aminomethyl-transferring glycine dehydrogenase [Elusimicrobiota bacterium]
MATETASQAALRQVALPAEDSFEARHIGLSEEEARSMASELGYDSLDALIDAVVPADIRFRRPLSLPAPLSERRALERLAGYAARNQVFRSYLGQGYHDCVTPPVIQRNVLENPGWYTAYTPYQAEIAQGRLEALLNFQQMVMDLTGFEVANASLLDEATAAAEAMHVARLSRPQAAPLYLVSDGCHPQTIEVVRTRAAALGLDVLVEAPERFDFSLKPFGVLLQYPDTLGGVADHAETVAKAKAAGAFVTMAADLLALALLTPPGELGADAAVGTTQRFGVPLGFGGPHAAYFAARDAYKRLMPGRVVGVSRDAAGKPAYRLALQTREQHIRRERATSNICTAQVLLAVAAGFYAVYHGPEGLRRIARRVHALALALGEGLRRLGVLAGGRPFFDTVLAPLPPKELKRVLAETRSRRINLRVLDGMLAIALDETTGEADVEELLEIFAGRKPGWTAAELAAAAGENIPERLRRRSPFLTHPVFNRHHGETEMLRYLRGLEAKDLSLTSSMIPLGSCTMKLNAASEMLPISWPGFSRLHPFAPAEQALGYAELFAELESWLAEITGLPAVSLQPNAGSQGEYAGLLAIRGYHQARGQGHRRVCLIPQSAHGTNPASAALAGFSIVAVSTLPGGDVDPEDLRRKAAEHERDLACLMVTYPSTHGVFEEGIREICQTVHRHGGLVYMDGANMNAQVGLCRPGDIGADVCHLNLHKTFCIPHGGGGPGVGPIAAIAELAAFLPRPRGGGGAVSAAPWGSAGILPISWAYIAMMGPEGLARASKTAILSANYVARKLSADYQVLFKGRAGLVAHECVLDCRPFKAAEVQVEDIAKRLMDYGFHAPTVSFPVPGAVMVEPTESEGKAELDRFISAMAAVRSEIAEIEAGRADRSDNLLKNAPHTAQAACADSWSRPYSRERAVFPAAWTRERKFWPAAARIDNALGDRQFCCSCPPSNS